MMQRHLQSLRLTPNGFLGGPTGQDPHVGPLPNLGPPHRHPSGDPLGIQSLANLGPPGSTPMMMPMMPFGLPPMGLLPFSNPSPGIHFPPSISPPPPAAHSPILGSPPSSSSLATWPSSQPTMFGSLTGPVAPFNTRDTGFPSSVLFPGDLHHPLLSPGSPTQASLPQPGLPSAMKPSSPDPDLASGSPVTPPNLGLHTFNFED